MRFAKLVVDNFQGIKHAEIAFAPGLNVLYGPNDLGKSTLARAIYAALLVPPGSSEAGSYASWYADAVPRVSLTLVDDADSYWRVEKSFGSGGSSSAGLSFSKDGISFSLDYKAREVEERVRGLLEWGIPVPGGKGSPRSLPTSFLANVLLAAQTDVDVILGKSLDDDLDASGKLRLTKALATLAQDVLFKKVLDAAQNEVDQCFTPTRQYKRGRTSKFTEAGNAIKQLEAERGKLEQLVEESSAIEENVNALRARHSSALVIVDEAAASLDAVREGCQRNKGRNEAVASLETARTALSAIEVLASRVNALTTEIESLTVRTTAATTDLAGTDASAVAADASVRAAEDRLRAATSEDGARERELRRAQLHKNAAELNSEKQSTEARKARAEAAAKLHADAQQARRIEEKERQEGDRLTCALSDARSEVAAAEGELALATSILAYGRWRAAAASAEHAGTARESAAKSRAGADEKDAQAAALDSRAAVGVEQVAARRRSLPTAENAAALGQLERELEVAEAGLGGGLTVTVRPRKGVAVRAEVDQKRVIDEGHLTADRLLVAERAVRLSVGELVDIEITAGAADKRRIVEILRERWKAEATPILERARAASVSEILTALGEIATEEDAAAGLRKEAETYRAEAKGLRANAAVYEEQAAKLGAGLDDLAARRAAIGEADTGILEAHFANLGKGWESQAEALHATKAKDFEMRRSRVATVEQAMKVVEYRASEAAVRTEELAAGAAAASAELGSDDPVGLAHAIGVELEGLAARGVNIAAQVSALESETNVAVEKAGAALELAKGIALTSRESRTAAAAALEEAQAALNARIGEREAVAAQLGATDRAGAEALVRARESAVSAFPSEPVVSQADLAQAEARLAAASRELEQAKEDLHKSEGALSKVGGASVREEVQRVEEALEGARGKEKDLEVDADAWKLLLETLRDVENEEGAHLGRALAGPVTAKFEELTAGRYGGVRLDAALKAEAVQVTGTSQAADPLAALSAGTRDQLATLVRLTIANQLKSAIILDDHLVHSDPVRLAWFRDVLTKTAVNTQVIVLTCRSGDYLSKDELPVDVPSRDLAGGTLRALDGARLVRRWEAATRTIEEPGL